MLIEILTYQLKSGSGEKFHQVVLTQSVPLLRAWGIHVVSYGQSMPDPDTYVLMRAFKDLDDLNFSQDTFYASDAWRQGPRETILDLIESSTNVVLPVTKGKLQDKLNTMIKRL